MWSFAFSFHVCEGSVEKHANRWIDYAKFFLDTCVHGSLQFLLCAQSSQDRIRIHRNPDQDKAITEDEDSI